MARSVTGGTKITRATTLNPGQMDFYEYTVPTGKRLVAQSFYGGGAKDYYFSVGTHDTTKKLLILNGGMESSGEVSAWPKTNGNLTAPSPDASAVQVYPGGSTNSLRQIYTQSGTQLIMKQTFGSYQDFYTDPGDAEITLFRYLVPKFYNDLGSGGTRTLSLILESTGNSSRTWTKAASLGVAPLTAATWYDFKCELENPGSFAGSAFDISQVTTAALKLSDSVNLAGTCYWDDVKLEDAFYGDYFIFGAANTTSPDVIAVDTYYESGDKLYILSQNNGAARAKFSVTLAGQLVNA
jgi:hypothetical protein